MIIDYICINELKRYN